MAHRSVHKKTALAVGLVAGLVVVALPASAEGGGDSERVAPTNDFLDFADSDGAIKIVDLLQEPVEQDGFQPDPRLADMIADQAAEALDDRYVDLWLAEDGKTMVLGVFAPTIQDRGLTAEWDGVAEVAVAACPVKRADLDVVVEQVARLVGTDVAGVRPDYINGRVIVTQYEGDLAQTATRIDAVAGLRAVRTGQAIPRSIPSEIVIQVEAGERPVPREAINSAPIRAGKDIQASLICTSNALVQVGTTRHMLTAGHCGAVNNNVKFGGVVIGKISKSNYMTAPVGSTVTGDYAMFDVPSTAGASVFLASGSVRKITGWASPRTGWQVCTIGRSTPSERCGKIEGIADPTGTGPAPYYNRNVTGLYWASEVGCVDGDSGSPVYHRGPNGVVISGIISGCGSKSLTYTPIGTALAGTGSTLVRLAGLGVPTATAVAPIRQIMLSPDFTQDGRGEVVVLDQANKLVTWETNTSGGLVTPAGVNQIGFTGYTMLAPGDWNKDGIPDLIGILDGVMYLFKGQGGGAISGRQQIGTGWAGFTVIAVGDVTSDGNPDLLAIKNSTGELFLYAGNGSGGFKSPYPKVGTGWGGFKLYGAKDLDGDGKADLLSVDSAGNLWFYKGKGDGTFAAKVQKGNGWKGFTLAAGADLNGHGKPDIVGRDDATRKLYFYRGTGSGSFATRVEIGQSW